MARSAPEGVKVPLPPPVLFLLVFLAGAGLGYLQPLRLGLGSMALRLALGGVLSFLALGIGLWAVKTMRRRTASPEFGRRVRALVVEGPYRFSRNPVYLALVLGLLALATALDSAWLAMGSLVLGTLLDRFVIHPEESYLAERFGAGYLGYTLRVRRWL
jgi:protein-S-isoprenylcysteine O-methyltransferase Ste14